MLQNNLVTPELKQAIVNLSNEFKPILEGIHNCTASTQNYYGDYLTILSQFSGNNGKIKLVALSLIYAGANVHGVESAVKILIP